jgi:hypothetical protein
MNTNKIKIIEEFANDLSPYLVPSKIVDEIIDEVSKNGKRSKPIIMNILIQYLLNVNSTEKEALSKFIKRMSQEI